MTRPDPHNTVFKNAVAFVNQTGRHLFLTGKAGTGKTTFLKYIRENSFKKTGIAAPTGVAAINAGGVTLHSLFQLPFGPFIPSPSNSWDAYDGRVNDAHSLFKNIHFSNAKRDLLRELDLLVIDEISMVRADMLDAVDAILRHIRKQPLVPYGGAQMLFIGDLFQLPPVIKNDEWKILKDYYKSPFFFDSKVVQEAPPIYIELKKIYRQTDEAFISILNSVRNNQCKAEDLKILHKYYKPDFHPPGKDHYITLTSHNEKANLINRRELQKLPGKAHSFRAEISGAFHERSFPADEVLQLKEGAQIMFIKNDKGEIRKFYNGKIGIVEGIADDKISISFPGEPEAFELEQETWQNLKYNYNKEKDKIEEEELGTFKQYPVRLAWAITIHKSQGLTFERAIIDAGASFAPGQVYVALSRLTSLKGLVLHSVIHPDCISTDPRVLQFVKTEKPDGELAQTLKEEQQVFVKNSLVKGFSLSKLEGALEAHKESILERVLPQKEKAVGLTIKLINTLKHLETTSGKFIRQLEQLYIASDGNYQQLYTRTKAAVAYFSKEIEDGLVTPLVAHFNEMKDEKKVKKYLTDILQLKRIALRQQEVLKQTGELGEALANAREDLLLKAQNIHQPVAIAVGEETAKKEKKAPKGETARISLSLYKKGKTIPEIAKERNLSGVTIEGHLAGFISTGEIEVQELITAPKLEKVLELLKEETEAPFSSELKSKLGDDFSYAEIKAAIKYWEKSTSPS